MFDYYFRLERKREGKWHTEGLDLGHLSLESKSPLGKSSSPMLAAVAILATVTPILTSPMDHMQKAFLLSEVNPYFAGLTQFEGSTLRQKKKKENYKYKIRDSCKYLFRMRKKPTTNCHFKNLIQKHQKWKCTLFYYYILNTPSII